MAISVDELARALRAYVGYPRTPSNPDGATWYLDFDSSASDDKIRAIAEDIVRAATEAPTPQRRS